MKVRKEVLRRAEGIAAWERKVLGPDRAVLIAPVVRTYPDPDLFSNPPSTKLVQLLCFYIWSLDGRLKRLAATCPHYSRLRSATILGSF